MNAAALQGTQTPVVKTSVKLSELSDAELVILCQSEDHRAFEVLMKRHQRMMNGMLNKMAPDWNDTADLTQEAFIRIRRGIGKLQNPKAFKTWICQIVTHLFYDELRKAPRRSPALSLDVSMNDVDNENATRDIPDIKAGPEEILVNKETTNVVGKAIQTLPEQFRTAIVLRDLEDMTYDDIAHLTQTDIGTVKSRISRARAKVQKVLTPQFGQDRKLSA